MLDSLAKYKIIPTLKIKDISQDKVLKVCEALIKGGLPLMEMQFRRHSDSLALQAVAERFPEFLIGAGGIVNSGQLLRAVECNINFASAPGVCIDTMRGAAKQKAAFIPGVVSPSDIQTVLLNGFADFQFFPAEPSGGTKYLRSILEPFEHLPLDIFPKGGITMKMIPDYFKIPHVTAVFLDEILSSEYIASEKWGKISDAASKAVAYANK